MQPIFITFRPVEENNSESLSMVELLDKKIFDNPWNAMQWKTEVANLANKVLFICFSKDRAEEIGKYTVAGFASYGICGDEIELKKIGVLSQYRNKSIGLRALENIIFLVKKEGFHKMVLEVSENNYPALQLYSHLKFQKIGIRKKYYSNLFNAIVMQKIF